MRSRTPRIQDIAQIAGVSTATVSRALSNPDIVAKATQRAVMEAVAKTGYRINHMARNLRRQRSGSILALVPNLANPFFSQILAGLSSVLSPAGYGLLIADTYTDPNPGARLTYYLDSGLADGVVIFDGTLPKSALPTKSHVPIVMACEWTDAPLPSVRVANAEGAEIAIRHLAAMGHRKIGYLTGPPGNVLTISRLAGMRAAMAALGLALRDDWIFEGDFGLACGAAAARRWMVQTDRPTAVFCASDEMACGFMGELQHAGHSVPGDVSVVGFDNIEVSSHLTPALTT
ncbi:MAG: LacI family DNA-binding transcriptional regulator, partial [Paracoccaceae bacterium]|nr:LacI family DNA-binding transcriptional regulator [Paracoccaceae bacterium]